MILNDDGEYCSIMGVDPQMVVVYDSGIWVIPTIIMIIILSVGKAIIIVVVGLSRYSKIVNEKEEFICSWLTTL